MKWILVALTGLALAGCQNRGELRAQQASEHEATCRSIGAQPGTDAYTDCRLRLMQIAAAENQAEQARGQRARMAVAAGMSRMSQGYYRAAAASRPVNCNSYRMGNNVQTTCY